MKVTIVGNGVLGNAMLHVLQKNTQEVAIATRGETIEEAEIVVLCVPVQAIRDVLPLVTFSGEKRIIVNTAKGIEQSTNKFPYHIIEEFYAPNKFNKFVLDYEQQFDLEVLIGRIISSSYMPNLDHPNFPQLKNAIVSLFNKYEQNGIVTFAYNTNLYIGSIK